MGYQTNVHCNVPIDMNQKPPENKGAKLSAQLEHKIQLLLIQFMC